MQSATVSTRFSATQQPAFGPGRRRHGGTLRTLCPHCWSPAKVRTSTQLTRTYKEIRAQCSNMDCGHTFVAELNIVRTIVPSAIAHPAVKLPMGQARPAVPANDLG